MKTFLAAAGFCLLVVFIPVRPVFAQVDTLTIIHVNDTHSNLIPYGAAGHGGIARAASVIGMWKMTEPNPILIHAGDLMVGTLFFNAYLGVPELQILNALGFDALCLGNHEFDLGPGTLAYVLNQAALDTTFRVISSNALALDSVPPLKALVRPYSVIVRHGVKIGIIGLTTPAANVESNPQPVFLDTNIVQDANALALGLRGAGCKVVILVSHLGLPLDMEIAHYLSGVSVIIGGHTHDSLRSVVTVNGIPIVQAGEYYRSIGKLRLLVHDTVSSVLDYSLQEITPAVPADSSIEATIDALKAGLSSTYSGVIGGDPFAQIANSARDYGYIPASIESLRTPMGGLITSALLGNRYTPKADCALEPAGHVAEKLYAGPITPYDVFRTYPYGYDTTDGLGFRLASYRLHGSEITGVLGALLGNVHPEVNDYAWTMQSSGLEYSVDTAGGLHLGSVTIGGGPVEDDSLYTIVSSDRVVGYLQSIFQITPLDLVIYPVSIFSVILDSVPRIIGAVRVPGMPKGFTLGQNFPNPFNPSTSIIYRLEKRMSVLLEVYNILGQKVETLIDGSQEAGEHQVRWAGRSVPSGVYLCRMKAGKFTETRKMLLLR